jgi:hypothetical protein
MGRTLLPAGPLGLGGEADADEAVVGLELLHGLGGVVDEGEAGGLAATELGAQAEDRDLVLDGLVQGAELLAELLLGDVGTAGVEDITGGNPSAKLLSMAAISCLLALLGGTAAVDGRIDSDGFSLARADVIRHLVSDSRRPRENLEQSRRNVASVDASGVFLVVFDVRSVSMMKIAIARALGVFVFFAFARPFAAPTDPTTPREEGHKTHTTICLRPSRGLRMNLRVRRVTGASSAIFEDCLTMVVSKGVKGGWVVVVVVLAQLSRGFGAGWVSWRKFTRGRLTGSLSEP